MKIGNIRTNRNPLTKFRWIKITTNDSGELITDYKIITKGLLDEMTDEQKSDVKLIIDGRVKLLEAKIEERTVKELEKIITVDMTEIQIEYFYKSVKKQATTKEIILAERRKTQHKLSLKNGTTEYSTQKVMLRKKQSELATHVRKKAEIDIEVLKEIQKRLDKVAKIARSSSDKAEQASLIGLHTNESEILIKRANCMEMRAIICEKKLDMAADKIKRRVHELERVKKVEVRAQELLVEIQIAEEIEAEEREKMQSEMTIGGKIIEEDRIIKINSIKEKMQLKSAEKEEEKEENRRINAEKRKILADKRVIAADKRVIAADKRAVAADRRAIAADRKSVEADERAVEAERRAIEAEKK